MPTRERSLARLRAASSKRPLPSGIAAGTTGGVTDDGRFIAVVRFESEEAAPANSAPPKQDAWWPSMCCAVSMAQLQDLTIGTPEFFDLTRPSFGSPGVTERLDTRATPSGIPAIQEQYDAGYDECRFSTTGE